MVFLKEIFILLRKKRSFITLTKLWHSLCHNYLGIRAVTTFEKSTIPEDISKYLPSEEELSKRLLGLFNENENTNK